MRCAPLQPLGLVVPVVPESQSLAPSRKPTNFPPAPRCPVQAAHSRVSSGEKLPASRVRQAPYKLLPFPWLGGTWLTHSAAEQPALV